MHGVIWVASSHRQLGLGLLASFVDTLILVSVFCTRGAFLACQRRQTSDAESMDTLCFDRKGVRFGRGNMRFGLGRGVVVRTDRCVRIGMARGASEAKQIDLDPLSLQFCQVRLVSRYNRWRH